MLPSGFLSIKYKRVQLETLLFISKRYFYLKDRANWKKQNASQKPIVLKMNMIHYKQPNITQK
jgi:IS4 transposase